MEDNEYIRAFGINYEGSLRKIKKSNDPLRPIYEAITNSLEAIRLLQDNPNSHQITISLKNKSTLLSDSMAKYEFESIEIDDNGIGFTDEEYDRFINLNDEGKGFNNRGSGRIQFLHFFDKSKFKSIYRDEASETGYKERYFILSKSKPFLEKNAIIFNKYTKDANASSPKTIVMLSLFLSEKDKIYYNDMKIENLKETIITHYLAYFCENRESLPTINLIHIVDDKVKTRLTINENDIPTADEQRDMTLFYHKISSEDNSVKRTINKELLTLKGYKIPKEKLGQNEIKLTSKGEISSDVQLDHLLAEDTIDNNRYLFLISGKYLDSKDNDTRGELHIPTLEEFKTSIGDTISFFSTEEILYEDIQKQANLYILEMYDEIKLKVEKKNSEIEKLRNMFLLNPRTIADVKITLNDSEKKILEKVYQADAKLIAKNDAEIKRQIDLLEKLDTSSDEYDELLEKEVDDLVKLIPLQNRTTLTHYVARRKLVLDLFNKILDKKLKVQGTTNRKYDEKLLHNLIFQQSSDNPSESDLWLVNEDFIYFKGKSEGQLNSIELGGKKLFKKDFSKAELEYLHSLGEKREINKPDVLLFPDEGKCIIIEFKNIDTNVAVHLNQINKYASLIRNFTRDDLQFDTFYGYLIGESIEARDVRGYDSDFKLSYHFDYLFRPSKTIIGEERSDGSLYTEVIKYSTLLKRAKRRNQIFIEKLLSEGSGD